MSKPLIIDSAEFAREQQDLRGEVGLRDLPRVLDCVRNPDGVVHFRLVGGMDRLARPVLRLSVSGSVELLCQRCLKSLDWVIDGESLLTLFDSEAVIDAAAEQDEELEGILARRDQSVVDLIDDKILLALPLAPKHDVCASEQGAGLAAGKPNPFAVLQQLKATRQADPD